jgi:hypothetical protein
VVTAEEILRIFSEGFKSDLSNLLYMLRTRGLTIEDIEPFLVSLTPKQEEGKKCPICGKVLFKATCCSNAGRLICFCGYIE